MTSDLTSALEVSHFTYTYHFLLMILWDQTSICNGFQDIQWRIWRNGWHDLKRPL